MTDETRIIENEFFKQYQHDGAVQRCMSYIDMKYNFQFREEKEVDGNYGFGAVRFTYKSVS